MIRPAAKGRTERERTRQEQERTERVRFPSGLPSYRLDFSKYNRGRAPIDTASDAGQVVGIFIKEPGADKIRFYFLEQDYICSISSYKDEKGRDMTRFTVDLTAEYQERYPDAGITEALRVEYTSTPY